MAVAAKLRHLIKVQKSTSTSDSVGDATLAYKTMVEVYADIAPISTRDRFIAAQAKSEATHRITVRYDSRLKDVNGSWRVLFGDRTFMVEGPISNTNERDRDMIMVCTEGLRMQ